MDQIKSHILNLSEAERSELLRWFISEMLGESLEWEQLAEALKRIQEWDGKSVASLSHEQFWSELDKHLQTLEGQKDT